MKMIMLDCRWCNVLMVYLHRYCCVAKLWQPFSLAHCQSSHLLLTVQLMSCPECYCGGAVVPLRNAILTAIRKVSSLLTVCWCI